MSTLLEELRAKWTTCLSTRSGGHEWRALGLPARYVMKVLAAVRDRDSRIAVLLETPLVHAPAHRVKFDAEGISLVDERSADEQLVRIGMTLERSDLRDIFEVIVLDLLGVVSEASTPEQAIERIARRLGAWQTCLRVRRRGLGWEEQIGLLGELTVLRQVGEVAGFGTAVAAWQGPLDGIHDFQARGLALEVKSTVGPSHQVRISKLDQLDDRGLRQLLLCRVRFQESAGGRTLPEQIASLRQQIEIGFPVAVSEFSERILKTGYLDSDAPMYSAHRLELVELLGYRVDPGFPRLLPTSVPPAVVDASYVLDERQLTAFRFADDAFLNSLRLMGAAE